MIAKLGTLRMTMTKHKLSQEMEATSTTTESDSEQQPPGRGCLKYVFEYM